MQKRYLSFLFLTLLFLVLPAVAAQNSVTSITYGDSVDGEITNPTEPDFYAFTGTAGEFVTISMESRSTDVYLQLYDSDQNLLTEHDDLSQDDLNALIEFELPSNDDYLILAGAYNVGRYTLSLDVEGGAPPQNNNGGGTVSDSEFQTIDSGDTLTGEAIDIDNAVIYTFTGQAGDTVNITASSDEVDTYLVLADESGNTIAENDDISKVNLNAQIEAVLPANGSYLIGVFGYSSGPFEVTLTVGGGGGTGDAPVTTVSDSNSDDVEVLSGALDNDTYFLEYPITVENDGSTITVEVQATSGDLDTYLGLYQGDVVVAENDDRQQGTTDSELIYPNAEAGEYIVVITRYGFDQGETAGAFDLSIKISAGSGSLVSGGPNTNVDPTIAGYPTLNPTSTTSDWTILVYMGGDNNLEDGLINDLDEFEIAGGSNESVRILVLLDRSSEYDDSNDDWTDTRVFEVGADDSKDSSSVYPPTIDSIGLFGLGEIDTSYANNLTDFLVWGIQNYPAQRYAVSINNHGGAWAGAVTDDTTGQGILSITDLQQSFASALETTNTPKFDLLINDACLMSSVEYYAAVAPYFNYSLSSPEITLNPSFDMTLLTEILNDNPSIDIADLSRLMVDKYLQDMTDLSPDTAPVLGAAVTDLSKIPALTTALDDFAGVVSLNPTKYGSLLGQVRANVYAYSFFLPEDEFGPATNIDLGHFMRGVIATSRDTALVTAAEGVLDALGAMVVYGNAGTQLGQWTSYYNIYFPARGSDFSAQYLETTPLGDWTNMLRGFYNSVSPRTARTGVIGAAPLAAPSIVPLVNITNVFPTETSVAVPTKVSMEVIGRNIANGTFTVDQIQPDGNLIRLESADIVTEVVTDGVVEWINLWKPGIDDFTFTWEVTLNIVTDGTTSNNELVSFTDDVTSLAGRYQFPGSEEWLEVTVIFDGNGNTSSVVSKSPGSVALSSIDPAAGGIFQTYQSIVTPDGRVDVQQGTDYIWPESGISWHEAPAPDGEYNLGFLVEAFGGSTGFDSIRVTVNNREVNENLAGFVDMEWNFIFQRPADWTGVTYFPDEGNGDFESANNPDATQFVYIYPVYDAANDLEAIANDVLDRFSMTLDGNFTPITVDGRDAVAFDLTYEGSEGTAFVGQAFAVYDPDLELGLVFSSEGLDAKETTRIFQLLRDEITFFDAQAIKEQDTGLWSYDFYTDNDTYPVRHDWLPGAQDGLFWYYHPDDDMTSTTFAAITVLTDDSDDAKETLDLILEQEIAGLPNYFLMGTDTYYAENHDWEWASFIHDGPNGEVISGRLYATLVDGVPYLLWFEAPADMFDQLMLDVFSVMLDGFKADPPEES